MRAGPGQNCRWGRPWSRKASPSRRSVARPRAPACSCPGRRPPSWGLEAPWELASRTWLQSHKAFVQWSSKSGRQMIIKSSIKYNAAIIYVAAQRKKGKYVKIVYLLFACKLVVAGHIGIVLLCKPWVNKYSLRKAKKKRKKVKQWQPLWRHDPGREERLVRYMYFVLPWSVWLYSRSFNLNNRCAREISVKFEGVIFVRTKFLLLILIKPWREKVGRRSDKLQRISLQQNYN